MNSTVSIMISALIFFFILRGQLSGMSKPLKKSGITLLLPILYISTSFMQLFDRSLHIHGRGGNHCFVDRYGCFDSTYCDDQL